MILQSPIDAPAPIDAGRRNFMLLVQLRWLAVGGQLATILAVRFLFAVPLPLVPMIAALAVLVGLNLAALAMRRRWPASNRQLLGGLLIDVACLTVQLYLSGGATNPFVTLYLLQVVIGAVLLEAWSSWLLVAVTSAAFAGLALAYHPLLLPIGYASLLSVPYVLASWFNFTLTAVLLVAFATRIARNLHERDAHLAELRQRAAEEEHIVRMGLLASGAAHELGTPLASIAVALGDWRGEPAIAGTPHLAVEVEEMRAEVARCKEILGGILFAAGEVTGEAPARTTLRRFVQGIVARWDRSDPDRVLLDDRLGADLPIVADRALVQALTNILDNAVEAGAHRITLRAERQGEMLVLGIRDDGTGFADDILARVGEPYRSSKERQGAGLGLFLSSNVLRTLGGTLEARNPVGGGAEVMLRLPLASLALGG
jgi:two-component system sensor histidine kinase RegB